MVANKLTANYASIANSNFSGGAIVGSSINVGDGRFVVNSAGSVFAADGTFQGTINARGGTFEGNIYASGEIIGGIITGARFRTGSSGVYPRVEIDPTSVAFGVYSDASSGILIPAYDGGVSKIRFLANGNESTIYNSPGVGLAISAYGNLNLSGSNIDLQPNGKVRFRSWLDIQSAFSGATLQSELDTINSAITALWNALNHKSDIGHKHTVDIGTHNHGNAANQNWGGTFTTSS
ncbi:hypothetical protein [Paenibacillus jilunlii]|uniref:Uncharacterized protein n=1 Tax=Paenibacillus jilunlii TaxID=682956 RepID=A0A1G9GQY1_9BACL|nr:hypothetical protein [Paenibacillus jilunlii]KWX73878.1 hypothetical protein AML91_16620 [Paenibacillus jilunlii]SDL03012.1 hypothetical protein SAMN05216191_101524 [Paenibacillus jilunlii]